VTTTELTATDLTHLERAVELAWSARNRGDHPFGSLLVTPDGVSLEAENTVVTGADPTGHAETNLVRLAGRLDHHAALEGIREAAQFGHLFTDEPEDVFLRQHFSKGHVDHCVTPRVRGQCTWRAGHLGPEHPGSGVFGKSPRGGDELEGHRTVECPPETVLLGEARAHPDC
jgi:hypothetical protein